MTTPPSRGRHLPEVAVLIGSVSDGLDVAQGAEPTAPQTSPGYRIRRALGSYLPLLLMALLAMATGWLVKNTPQIPGPTVAGALREDPDYTMTGFSISRFGPDGSEVLRIAGDVLRHYPATDRFDIDGVRIHATAPDGRITDASASRALANGDGSEIQLLGDAHVTSRIGDGEELEMRGEFLHAFLRFERLRSHLPVQVRRGGTETHAGGLDYDHLTRQLQFLGPVRTTLQPGRPSGVLRVVPSATDARP
jgi:lipopolysaccharide export system protein LptC